MDDADADLGDERARAASPIADGAIDQRPPVGSGGGPSTGRRPSGPTWAATSRSVALEQHPRRRAVPQHRRRPVQPGERLVGIDRAAEPLLVRARVGCAG